MSLPSKTPCHNAGIGDLSDYGHNYAVQALRITKARIEVKYYWIRFIEGGHKAMLRAKGVLTAQDAKDLATDALDFEGAGTDINVARSKTFLRALAESSTPRSSDHEKLSVSFIKNKRDTFFLMVLHEMLHKQKLTPSKVTEILGRRVDYESSFYGLVNTAVAALIDEFGMVNRQTKPVDNGRHELELLLLHLLTHLTVATTLASFDAIMGVVVCCVTGLRIGSLAATGSSRQGSSRDEGRGPPLPARRTRSKPSPALGIQNGTSRTSRDTSA